jgi:adenine-specific DNA-methyltransferase
MRYIGSKTWCLRKLRRLISREVPKATSLCDPFAGTCTVARFFKEKGFQVTTGDLLSLSYAFQVAGIRLNRPPTFRRLLARLKGTSDHNPGATEFVLSYLAQVPGRDGWITRNYSLAGSAGRKFFTVENARRLDAILLTIRRWSRGGLISPVERWYLLACVLEAGDRVANIAGTYYAYLSRFYRKARKPIVLRPIVVLDNGERNTVHHAEAAHSVRATKCDVLYLDPPYNERDYGAYYHLPELLADGRTPKVSGQSGRPGRTFLRSPFCSKSTAAEALREVLLAADARLIILHYAKHGLIGHQNILTMMRERGPTRAVTWYSRAYASSRARPKPPRFCTRVYICRPR